MRMREQSPNGGERVEHVVGRERAVRSALDERVGVRDPAHHRVVLVAAGDEEVRGRQHRHRDPRRREPLAERPERVGGQQRVLGAVTDGDPPSVPMALGQLAHQVDVHLVGGGTDVEVDVDVAVVVERELEDAPDLSRVVRVVGGCSTDHRRASLQCRHHVAVGLRRVGPALLCEHAQLQIDRPRIVDGQRLQGLESAQTDVGVDLHVGAHVGDAVQDAPLQGLRGPRVDVVDREPRLDRGHPLHVVAGPARGRGAPLDDARLVEVDVGLDESGGDQAAVDVEGLGIRPDLRLDGDDPIAGEPDVHQRRVRIRAGDAGPVEHEVRFQAHASSSRPWTAATSARNLRQPALLPSAMA